jgi:hypothetical protein
MMPSVSKSWLAWHSYGNDAAFAQQHFKTMSPTMTDVIRYWKEPGFAEAISCNDSYLIYALRKLKIFHPGKYRMASED